MSKRLGGEVFTDSDFLSILSPTLEIRHGCSDSMIAFSYVSICIDGVVKKFNVTVLVNITLHNTLGL